MELLYVGGHSALGVNNIHVTLPRGFYYVKAEVSNLNLMGSLRVAFVLHTLPLFHTYTGQQPGRREIHTYTS